MDNKNDHVVQSKIPYLSAAKMGRLMELVSERSLTIITPEYFKNYGFGQADAYLAINTLKFLGVIDDNGKSTDVLRRFQLRGDIRNMEVQQILKVVYKRLFDAVDDPYKLSKDDLTNEFMHHYSLSRRIAISAVPAFLKLCEFAGLVDQGSVITRKRIDKSNKKQSDDRSVNKGSDINNVNISIPIDGGKMEWKLPSEIFTKMAFGGDIAEDIRLITTQLSNFAKKYLQDESNKENL